MSSIAYDLTKIKAVVFDIDGVISPSVIPVDDNGKPVRMANVKDVYAMHEALKAGIHLAIISSGNSPQLEKGLRAMGMTDIYFEAHDKLPILKELLNKLNLTPEMVAYMGDDIPDLKCMRYVGLSVAPHDAAHEACETAIYISRFNGGYGCVRDLLEQIMKAQNLWIV